VDLPSLEGRSRGKSGGAIEDRNGSGKKGSRIGLLRNKKGDGEGGLADCLQRTNFVFRRSIESKCLAC